MIKLLNLLVDTTPGLDYHLRNGLPISENIYRYSSDAFIQLFNEARTLHRDGYLQLSEEDRLLLETTDIGKYGEYQGRQVKLDLPEVDEELDEAEYHGKEVALNKPKRGGSKKFYVYTKNKKGNVVKVQFGDTSGLSVKINEPGARASFAARHQCDKKKDKTKAGYWSCNVGRYWKSLGGAKNFSGYW